MPESGREFLSGRYELEILCCDAEDDAQWRVVGKNAFGECESKCRLTVEIPEGLRAPEFLVRRIVLL